MFTNQKTHLDAHTFPVDFVMLRSEFPLHCSLLTLRRPYNVQWPGVWCSPGVDGAAGYGESGMVTAGFVFFRFFLGVLFGEL